jgi:hypothetical protein
MLELEIPIRIISSANLVEHWSKKYKREHDQRQTIGLYLRPILDQIALPIKITLIRIAPRQLDDDNLAYSLKSHRDEICNLIRPGLAPGRADGDRQIMVKYMQKKGNPKEYALRIIFEPLTEEDKW